MCRKKSRFVAGGGDMWQKTANKGRTCIQSTLRRRMTTLRFQAKTSNWRRKTLNEL
jgi:hypothetical protein